jgi:hypothetical protein
MTAALDLLLKSIKKPGSEEGTRLSRQSIQRPQSG